MHVPLGMKLTGLVALGIALLFQTSVREPATIGELRIEVRALRESTDARFASLREIMEERQKEIGIASAASDKAIQKAEDAQLRVNLTQNEFRGTLKDQAATLATKDSMDRLLERVVVIEKTLAGGEGAAGSFSRSTDYFFRVGTIVISLAALIVAVLVLVTRRRPPTT